MPKLSNKKFRLQDYLNLVLKIMTYSFLLCSAFSTFKTLLTIAVWRFVLPFYLFPPSFICSEIHVLIGVLTASNSWWLWHLTNIINKPATYNCSLVISIAKVKLAFDLKHIYSYGISSAQLWHVFSPIGIF